MVFISFSFSVFIIIFFLIFFNLNFLLAGGPLRALLFRKLLQEELTFGLPEHIVDEADHVQSAEPHASGDENLFPVPADLEVLLRIIAEVNLDSVLDLVGVGVEADDNGGCGGEAIPQAHKGRDRLIDGDLNREALAVFHFDVVECHSKNLHSDIRLG